MKNKEKIVDHARQLGVSDVKIISPNLIPIDNKFVEYCSNPGCSGYGQSMSCPPNVEGPDWFRTFLKKFDHALVFKYDVPSYVLLGEERHDLTRLIHKTAASIELFAAEHGHPNARGFAGGSCKLLFCSDHNECRVLSQQGECRNKDQARQSMSGMGVNFLELTKVLGWKMGKITKDTDPEEESMAMMAGMVLLGEKK